MLFCLVFFLFFYYYFFNLIDLFNLRLCAINASSSFFVICFSIINLLIDIKKPLRFVSLIIRQLKPKGAIVTYSFT